MSKQTINIGASPNDGTGTPLRTSFDYTNQNFTEIYTALGGGVALPGATTQVIFNDGGTNLAGDAGLVYNKTTDALTVAGLVTAGSATITGDLTVNGSYIACGSNSYIRTDATNLFSVQTGTLGFRIMNAGNSALFYGIDSASTSTWYDGAGGTRMTLNSTGLGVGDAPAANSKLTIGAVSATGLNYALFTTGVTTGRLQTRLGNTGGVLLTGIEGSTAGQTITGSAAYSAFIGTTIANPLYLITDNAIRATVDATGNLLVGTTSTAGSSSNATALVLGGARTANGSVSATTAVATTIFSITAALTGRYEVVALIGFSGAPAQYTAIATIIWDGNGSRVVANNGSNLTITISGSNVQITQTSGSTQTVSWSFLRIAL